MSVPAWLVTPPGQLGASTGFGTGGFCWQRWAITSRACTRSRHDRRHLCLPRWNVIVPENLKFHTHGISSRRSTIHGHGQWKMLWVQVTFTLARLDTYSILHGEQ